jgi:hypothetical protein
MGDCVARGIIGKDASTTERTYVLAQSGKDRVRSPAPRRPVRLVEPDEIPESEERIS